MATGAATAVPGTEGSAYVDGIAVLRDWLVFDDNKTGRVLGWRDGTLATLAEAGPSAADLGVAGDLLLVPMTDRGEVVAYRFKE